MDLRWIRLSFFLLLLGACSTRERLDQSASKLTEAKVLTFSETLKSKMFIKTVSSSDCRSSAVAVVPRTGDLNVDLARYAAFVAFCSTIGRLSEDPRTDDAVSPLDARVLSSATVQFKCSAGSAQPFGGSVVAGSALGGPEGPFTGVANPVAVRNDINGDGSYAFVSSGHPNPFAELGFQVQRLRSNRNIWDKVVGQISCTTDPKGWPGVSMSLRVQNTRFPSHRAWSHVPAGQATANLFFDQTQASFANLWALPAVPAP